jgi:hypothetical protein
MRSLAAGSDCKGANGDPGDDRLTTRARAAGLSITAYILALAAKEAEKEASTDHLVGQVKQQSQE